MDQDFYEDIGDIEETDKKTFAPSSPLYRREKHLSSAILTSEIDYVFRNCNNLPALRPHHIQLLDCIARDGVTVIPSDTFLTWGQNKPHLQSSHTEVIPPIAKSSFCRERHGKNGHDRLTLCG